MSARLALWWLAAVLGTGVVLASGLLWPEAIPHPALAFGRLLPVHTHLVFYGFLAHGLLAAVRDPGRTSRGALAVWNLGVLAGVLQLAAGGSTGKAYAELPFLSRSLLALGAFALLADRLSAVARPPDAGAPRPLSFWVLLPLTPALPLLLLANTPAVTDGFDRILRPYQGQNILGYCLAGFLAVSLFLATHRGPDGPLLPSARSLSGLAAALGAFGILELWPRGADGVLPEGLQELAILASLGLLLPLASASRPLVRSDRPEAASARLLQVGLGLYLLVSLQGAFQFSGGSAAWLLGSEWIVGHGHLAVAGAFTSLVLAAVADHLDPLGPRPGSRSLDLALGITLIGLLGMVAVLSAAGLRVGSGAGVDAAGVRLPDGPSWQLLSGYWRARLGFGILMTAGLAGLSTTLVRDTRRLTVPAARSSQDGSSTSVGPWVALALSVPLVAAGATMLARTGTGTGTGTSSGARDPVAEAVDRGRAVYLAEGCVACHTRRPRDLELDAAVGPPATAADYPPGVPPLMGTRRIGPDLLRVGARSHPSWLVPHLRDPRVRSPGSPMPSYAHLDEAQLGDLLAFLASTRYPGPTGATNAPESIPGPVAGPVTEVAPRAGRRPS